MLGLSCILPWLEAIHFFIKFSQLHDVFVCDFIVIVKICQGEMQALYLNITAIFRSELISINSIL
jgi:hypothetical protein